ncbi:DUF4376 domain-containing protein [Undibacterium sp. Ji50W]|uniref:DUF4376 domain-containing protein n=1 Tax=Undibacterium sp. Ji50W TaxID=3413041 RepID=UPI003BF199A4
MNLIKNISDNVVICVGEFVFTDEGAKNGVHVFPNLTRDNSVIETIQDVPDDFVGGMYTYLNGVWTVTAHGSALRSEALAIQKVAKNAQINEWRLAANLDSFTYLGKHIASDLLSLLDIYGANGEILNHGVLPVSWKGGWKAKDNTYVPIATTADWLKFYSAMYNQGSTNFDHSQMLKATLAAATTTADIDAIVW